MILIFIVCSFILKSEVRKPLLPRIAFDGMTWPQARPNGQTQRRAQRPRYAPSHYSTYRGICQYSNTATTRKRKKIGHIKRITPKDVSNFFVDE